VRLGSCWLPIVPRTVYTGRLSVAYMSASMALPRFS
jgi:hypothetical protein